MVTKEQRRGVAWDMEHLAQYVRQLGAVHMGQIQLKFRWGASKTRDLMASVAEAYEDIERFGRTLVHSPPPGGVLPSGEEEKISGPGDFPVARKIMDDEEVDL